MDECGYEGIMVSGLTFCAVRGNAAGGGCRAGDENVVYAASRVTTWAFPVWCILWAGGVL